MPNLYVIAPNGEITHFPLEKEKITIGRSKDNDLVLLDGTVSRRHAEIYKSTDGYILSDLGSYNKTRLNGTAITKALLQHGDKIQVGNTKLSFLLDSAGQDQLGESLILTTETEEEREVREVLASSSAVGAEDSRQLLVSFEGKKRVITGSGEFLAKEAAERVRPDEQLSALERTNRVLFVLYEISRHMSQIYDFDELLKKIMDLIFVVIDADSGFLVLTSGIRDRDIIPVVVKHRDGKGGRPREIRASRTLIEKVIHDKVALLTSNAMADTRLNVAESVMIQQIRSAICVPLWRKDEIIGVIQLDSIRLDNQFTQDDLELLKAIGSQVAMVIEQAALNEQIREEERMRNRLERFHSPQVIDMILKAEGGKQGDIMEPKELTATILFTDIVGFTSLSESLPPREINLFLNRHFSRLTDIIFDYDGTLDKYMGDGLMAVFGAPLEKEDDAERAVRAALEILRESLAMMEEVGSGTKFNIRIGINTGRVVAGNIGSPRRMEYTVIGDPVNIASRLESIAQPNQILIGEETYRLVKDKFFINKVGPRKVKGKTAEIFVYEVTGEKDETH